MGGVLFRWFLVLLWLVLVCSGTAAESTATFRLATFNLENYLLERVGTRPLKNESARRQIRASLLAAQADVVALQEVGGLRALEELRSGLRRDGLDYPFWELVYGWDTNIQVAVLSRWPIVARRPHTNEAFLLFGRKFHVSRGFLEIDLRVRERYSFTLITAHLKSRRPIPEADEAELREQEALVLRRKIDHRLSRDPNANLVVLGDLNDVKDARSTRAIIGRGRLGLIDTRPAERNGDNETGVQSRLEARRVTWTHHYGKEDTYSRVDYILLSRGMAREWIQAETFIVTVPNWGMGSDHRPIVATFNLQDR